MKSLIVFFMLAACTRTPLHREKKDKEHENAAEKFHEFRCPEFTCPKQKCPVLKKTSCKEKRKCSLVGFSLQDGRGNKVRMIGCQDKIDLIYGKSATDAVRILTNE